MELKAYKSVEEIQAGMNRLFSGQNFHLLQPRAFVQQQHLVISQFLSK